ncbi:MAG: hypothetical protein ACTHLE_20265 [Agriterribacter sp.]
MKHKQNILSKVTKYGMIVIAVFVVAQYVMAATGIRVRSGGEDKGKSASSAGSFSNIKSTVTFSIKDNYRVNTGNAFMNASKPAVDLKMQSSVVTYKKGNVVYLLPYKTQSGVKLPGFIKATPCQSAPINR